MELDLSACRNLKDFVGTGNPLEIIYVWKGWIEPTGGVHGWMYPEFTQIVEK